MPTDRCCDCLEYVEQYYSSSLRRYFWRHLGGDRKVMMGDDLWLQGFYDIDSLYPKNEEGCFCNTAYATYAGI